MSNTEYIDIYDGMGRPTGEVRSKLVVHKEGLWHRSFHCWFIFRNESGEDLLILQKRSHFKKAWPNKMDITAAGHYIQSEGIEGGLREIREELGINIIQEKLIYLGIRVCVEEFEQTSINHEYQDVYFYIENRPLDKYKISKEEVTGLALVSIDECLRLFSGEIDELSANGYEVDLNVKTDNVMRSTSYIITRDSFIPTLDNYNYKIMILAKRALNKEKHLLI